MRSFGAAMAVALLVLSLGSAAADAAPKSSFNGDFDALVNGEVVGHITVQTSGLAGGPGTWSVIGPYNSGSGVVGEAIFSRHDGSNEVSFTVLEVGYPTLGYGILTAHVVDYLDPSATDTIEFWTAPIDWDRYAGGSIGAINNFTWDVGPGAFVLKVRES